MAVTRGWVAVAVTREWAVVATAQAAARHALVRQVGGQGEMGCEAAVVVVATVWP